MQRNSEKYREIQRNVEKYREIQRHAEFLECLDTFKKYCWQPWDPINHKENYPGYFHCLFSAESHYCWWIKMGHKIDKPESVDNGFKQLCKENLRYWGFFDTFQNLSFCILFNACTNNVQMCTADNICNALLSDYCQDAHSQTSNLPCQQQIFGAPVSAHNPHPTTPSGPHHHHHNPVSTNTGIGGKRPHCLHADSPLWSRLWICLSRNFFHILLNFIVLFDKGICCVCITVL